MTVLSKSHQRKEQEEGRSEIENKIVNTRAIYRRQNEFIPMKELKNHTTPLKVIFTYFQLTVTWCNLYCVFIYIYSLLVEKDLHERSNVSVKCPCSPLVSLWLHLETSSFFR